MSLRTSPPRRPRTTSLVAVAAAGLLSVCGTPSHGLASAAELDPFSEQVLSSRILGHVEDAAGIAQMGATVYLYNRYDQLVRHVLTNEQGRFGFDALAPDIYSLRVVLASFAPAERRNISLLPNTESRLKINLSGALSTVTIAPPRRAPSPLMGDDWKWILRSSSATRPVMRFLPGPVTATSRTLGSAFSDTTGVVKLSAGDGQSFLQGGEDLGTAFAVATSLAGSARVQLSGNVGYAASNLATPGAGFRTSYSRESADGSSPEIVLTFHQYYTAPRAGIVGATVSDSAPPLRTTSLAVVDSIEVAESIRLDYGFNDDSVIYLDHLNYASPFARATFDLGSQGRIRVAYSSGAPPAELLARDSAVSSSPDRFHAGELDQDLTALSLVPRISLSNNHAVVQRTQNFEMGYERVVGPLAFTAGAYRESVSNAAFMLTDPSASVPSGNLMPDLNSSSSILNVGSYQRTGVDASVRQSLGDRFDVAVAAGSTGALALGGAAASSNGSGLRDIMTQKQVAWVTIRASATAPVTGTRLTADYGWTDPGTLVPTHVFMTQKVNQDTGLNFYLRQPLPGLLPVRMELTAELRNLLAQGYLSMGEHSVLTASPRAVRGGLNFIF
jgi:Carboxypeptidase regulatory-like domain